MARQISNSLIVAEFDLDANGKHHGFLRLPHSVHRSAYGWLPVPIVSIKNGDGTCVLLMSGNHGDEYEGQVVNTKLVNTIDLANINGQIIILPMANFPAARAGLRTSPIDEGNLNRSFPGDANGNVTQMLAHFIEHELMTRADYALDMHSGGSSLEYLPSVLSYLPDETESRKKYLHLIQTLGIQHGIAIEVDPAAGYSSSAALRQNTVAFTIEMGGAGTVNPDYVSQLWDAVHRLLHKLDVMPGAELPSLPVRMMEITTDDYYSYANDSGVFEPLKCLGDSVKQGELGGLIHDPATPWRTPSEVYFEHDGLLICKRIPAQVERGDCLFHLATDVV